MAIAPVVEWQVEPRDNTAHHPTGPGGERAVRMSQSFRELQAAIAQFNAAPVFTGNLAVIGDLTVTVGAFTSVGIDDNATGLRVQVLDGGLNLGDATSGESFGHAIRGVTDGRMTLSGSTSSELGGAAFLFGNTHSVFPGDVQLRSSDNTFLAWDESLGALTISTGVGAKTNALTIDASQIATFAGQIAANDTVLVDETVGGTGFVGRQENTGVMRYGGSNSPTAGSFIQLHGEGHANANDFAIASADSNIVLQWDESQGSFVVNTGVGAKTLALTIASSQEATFAGQIVGPASTTARATANIPEGVAPTSPADGDLWITAAGEFFARLNGVSKDVSRSGVAEVAGHTKAGNLQMTDGTNIGSIAFGISTDITKNTWENIGPTGSGATNIWDTIDEAIAAGATVLHLYLYMQTSTTGASTAAGTVYAAKGGVTGSASDDDSAVGEIAVDPGAATGAWRQSSMISVPVDSSGIFQMQWTDANSDSTVIRVYYRGFTTND